MTSDYILTDRVSFEIDKEKPMVICLIIESDDCLNEVLILYCKREEITMLLIRKDE